MSQLPDPQSLNELADAFERLQGRRVDPAEDAHRRSLERIVVRLAAGCGWVFSSGAELIAWVTP